MKTKHHFLPLKRHCRSIHFSSRLFRITNREDLRLSHATFFQFQKRKENNFIIKKVMTAKEICFCQAMKTYQKSLPKKCSTKNALSKIIFLSVQYFF